MELRGKKHCVVIIDMLNDFIGENAALRCENGEKIVPKIQELIQFAHEHNIKLCMFRKLTEKMTGISV